MIFKTNKNKSIFVTILGPDGSGKSTLIENLERELKGAFRRSSVFHLMPGILKKKKNTGPVTDPHGKPPRSTVMSLLKLLYYLFDYNMGYLFKIRPLLIKSTLVMFDRYFDDIIVDPRRYRYGGPLRAVRWIRKLIPKPDVVFILDVPEEEILKRKQEVSPEEVKRQREAYRNLALELPNAFIIDGSKPSDQVAKQVRDIILDYLNERYISRRPVYFPQAKKYKLNWLEKALGGKITEKGETFLHIALPDGRGYLLPASSKKVAVKGLSMYAPQKKKTKVAKEILRLGILSGVANHLLPKINIDLEEIKELLRDVFGERDLHISISLGTPGPHRKPVLQVATSGGEILGYAKVGWNEITKELVINDAVMNEKIRRMNFKDLYVPQIIHFSKSDGCTILITSPIKELHTTKWDNNVKNKFIKIMALIADKTRHEVIFRDTQFWEEINERFINLSGYLPEYQYRTIANSLNVIEIRLGKLELPWVLRLGDTTRWNMGLDRRSGSLILIDLEYAKEEWLVGWDLFRFFMDDITPIPECKISEYFQKIGVDIKILNSLQLAFWVDLFTEWVLAWEKANLPISTAARDVFHKIIGIIHLLNVK